MFTRNGDKFRVSELEDKLEQANHDHEIAVNKIRREHAREIAEHTHKYADLQGDYNRLTGDHEDEIERLNSDHENDMEFTGAAHDRQVDDLNARLDASEKNNVAQSTIKRQEIALEKDTAVLEAERKAFGDVKTAVMNAREEGEKNAEGRYKNGYADGLSDGLRKASELFEGERGNLVAMANKVVDNHKPAVAPDVFILPSGASGSAKQNKDEKKKD